jgi:hypothetical protein
MMARINQHMETSQRFGERGEVEKSLHYAQEAEKMNTEKEILEQRLKFPSGRIMFVCEICGVFINSTDNEARRADHYNGKQYLGWKAIRDRLKQLEEKFSGLQEVRELKKKESDKLRKRSNINSQQRYSSCMSKFGRYEKKENNQ